VQGVKYAQGQGLKVAAKGMGHSAGGQSQVQDGLVIDMTSLDRIHQINTEAGYFVADAGIRWSQLMDALLPLGWAPAIVTDWLHLTLGGTICAGGVGAQSFKHGIQADLIAEMEIVTGTGDLLTCSTTENSDLFYAVLGGLGQYGIITRAKMGIVPAPLRLSLNHLIYDDLRLFLRDVEVLMQCEGVDGLLSHAVGNRRELIFHSTGLDLTAQGIAPLPTQGRWVYDLEVLRYHDPETDQPQPLPPNLNDVPGLSFSKVWTLRDFIYRIPPIVERDQRQGRVPHPELALFLPHGSMKQLVGDILAETPIEDMGGGPILMIPLDSRLIKAPFFRLPDSPYVWLFALLRAASNPQDIDRLTQVNRDIYYRAIAYGGIRYPCDGISAPATEAEWSQHFGAMWPEACEAKAKYDPDCRLSPKLGIF
jgi:FAD/FMN-containing dehydrogenase